MNRYTFGPKVQFKEEELDRIFQDCFGYKTDGTFVEVGAYDGKTYSHTWGLAELGWRGVYCEPVPTLADQCRKNHADHKNVTIMEAAIGIWDGGVELHVDEFSCCGSTINPDICKHPLRAMVKCLRLDSALETELILPGFDLLSIDVEFGEVEVLTGFDLGRWLPKMVIIELCENHPEPKRTYAKPARDLCATLFPAHGYSKRYSDMLNTIFVRP